MKRKLPKETCEKIGAAEKGIPKSLECCVKIFTAQRNESPFKNLFEKLNDNLLTYIKLTKLLGLSHSSVSRKIRGETSFTSKDKAKLKEIFGKSAEYLL